MAAAAVRTPGKGLPNSAETRKQAVTTMPRLAKLTPPTGSKFASGVCRRP